MKKTPFDTEERCAYRDSMAKFVQKEIEPFVDQWDEDGDFPWELHQKAGELGMFAAGIDEKYGGLGLDYDDAFMRAWSAIEMGKSSAGGVMASLGSRNIMTGPIQKLASDDIKDKCLADIVSGRKGGALGITEPGGGSDVANLQTKAVKDGNHYVINGSKTFITGGMKADYFVIGARTGDAGLAGISLFFVEADAEGFSRQSVGGKMGWWASDTATLFLDNVRVPAENMLGQENMGFLSIMNNFNYERLMMVGQMIGMAERCLDESIKYAQDRETFGKPMIKHQVIRHKIADMSAKIDSMAAWLNQICWMINEGDMPVEQITKAKFSASKMLEYCASEAMQIFGGAGYLRGNPVERIYRDVKVMAIGGGSEEIMRDLAVRQMGL
ncbi:acyl-CoA dehydrogenase family protein [Kordiimonas sp. SCSIO 12603]|uniref:acyl-CoA dehydrogenase family protein n=1 Tax=Kordiimonas sp. SCSIO 12603 TaxID=2829596 RepID=UPI00210230C5|nr:acyl-CoA dehydrogenase family protein [Kordiimonas sp. SCSIO 12603]UTW58864.1 acyl-CoA dehydrogenase family protein [Kordiimonas sp. SCSIO 12603]